MHPCTHSAYIISLNSKYVNNKNGHKTTPNLHFLRFITIQKSTTGKRILRVLELGHIIHFKELIMKNDLTTGSITIKLLAFAFPLMLGNLFQQFYNLADTFIVGKFIGNNALAAVGSAYTLMTFITSIILGLAMGSGAYFSIQFGRGDYDSMKRGIFQSFIFIGILTLIINIGVYIFMFPIIRFLNIPPEVSDYIRTYLTVIYLGLFATFLYNFFASLLRAVGNSKVPLMFLSASVILNVVLDILFVAVIRLGVHGAALATIVSQYVSGIGLTVYTLKKFPELKPQARHMDLDLSALASILSLSLLTCLQQSIMNFGILMVQGLVNSFGPAVMAAFTIAVKIDTLAYMPVQDFGNAFSTFVAQNYGAGKFDRIRRGFISSAILVLVFCIIVSLLVVAFSEPLMAVFTDKTEDPDRTAEVIQIGAEYLKIEGSFYFGIGFLFMFYGYYRAINRPGISVILTIASLGTRVALAYYLSGLSLIGVFGIWVSIPIGWILADIIGVVFLFLTRPKARAAA